MDKLLDKKDVADLLKVSIRYVQQLASSGKLQTVDLGNGKRKVLRFRREDIEAFVESKVVRPPGKKVSKTEKPKRRINRYCKANS